MKRALPSALHGGSLGLLAITDSVWVTVVCVAVAMMTFAWHAYNEFSRGWHIAAEQSLTNIHEFFAKRNAS